LVLKKGKQKDYMLSTHKQYSILQIAKMFKTKIKFCLLEMETDLGLTYLTIMLSTIWDIKLKLI